MTETSPKGGPVAQIRFTAAPWSPMVGKGWTFVDLPTTASAALGVPARVAVRGTINGFAFRSSVFPNGAGPHRLAVNSQLRTGGRISTDSVTIFVRATATDRVRVAYRRT